MGLLASYNMQDNAASTVIVAAVGSDATYGGGANTSAKSVAGPGGLYPLALRFNGSPDFASTPSIAFASRIVCLSYWVNAAWESLKINFESSSNYNSGGTSTPRWASHTHSTSGENLGAIKGTGYNSRTYAGIYGTWTHIVDIFDTNQAAADGAQVDKYINAVLQTRTSAPNTEATSTSNFQSNIVYIASRAGTSLFRVCDLAGLKFYNHRLTQDEITALFAEAFVPARNESGMLSGGFQTMSGGL